MRNRERQRAVEQALKELADVLGDYHLWRAQVADLAKRGYPVSAAGGSSLGSSRGVADPVFAAVAALEHCRPDPNAPHDEDQAHHVGWRTEPLDASLRQIDKLLEDLLGLARRASRLKAWAKNSPKPDPETTDRCKVNACQAQITGQGNDIARDGRCPRCARHWSRYSLEYPNRYVAAGTKA